MAWLPHAVHLLGSSDFCDMSVLALQHLEVGKYSRESLVAELYFFGGGGGKVNTAYTRL